ncbi:hypothetical protein Taro_024237 [Colocasia esculenta]|uniref:Protein FAR1-RELATED SEQUENCE n=1 Tax=Colocasia esculenta TaxID=4460 RepID=A0A843V5W3_COLES|nr:hypothetical protein [Colocasia esculenta]
MRRRGAARYSRRSSIFATRRAPTGATTSTEPRRKEVGTRRATPLPSCAPRRPRSSSPPALPPSPLSPSIASSSEEGEGILDMMENAEQLHEDPHILHSDQIDSMRNIIDDSGAACDLLGKEAVAVSLTNPNISDDGNRDHIVPDPRVGMVFETEKAAFEYYNQYARQVGFSVRWTTRTLSRKTGLMIARKFVCSKEGHNGDGKIQDLFARYPREGTRCGCPAFMKIKLGSDGKYQISRFNTIHNHELATPNYVHMLRSQRKISSTRTAVAKKKKKKKKDAVADDCKFLESRRNQELEANFRMTQSQPCVPPVSIIKHAARVYTSPVFYVFMAEYVVGLECLIKDEQHDGSTQILTVEDGRHHDHMVTINLREQVLSCSCQKFEVAGILCGHVLSCITNDLRTIPDRYVLKRWTRTASTCSDSSDFHAKALAEAPKVVCSQRYRLLIRDFVPLLVKASEDEDTYKCALKHKSSMHDEIERIAKEKSVYVPMASSDSLYYMTQTRSIVNEMGSQWPRLPPMPDVSTTRALLRAALDSAFSALPISAVMSH